MTKKNDPPQSGNPLWLKWAVLAFIAYAIFINYTERTEKNNQDQVLGVTGKKPAPGEPALEQADLGGISLPDGMIVTDDIAGSGEAARCGQTATVTYDILLPETANERGEKDQERTLMVGLSGDDSPWAQAVRGMKPEGIRIIKTQAGDYYDETQLQSLGLQPSDAIRYKMEMQDVTPAVAPGHIPFQAITRDKGRGKHATCGSLVELHLTLWDDDGTVKYESRENKDGKPLSMRIGNAEYFYGLDRGMLNMRHGGVRMLIIPPAYANPAETEGNPFARLITGEQVVLGEITLVDVGDDGDE